MLGFLQRQFLPAGLVTVAVVGVFFPAPGIYMASLPTQYIAVSFIFLLSGLMLRTDEVHAALATWKATSWGCVSILFATPLLGTVLAFQIPMEPSFQLGLALFCCMPTTLTSGVALTAQARGNVALALLLTVLTNTAGILTVPFVLAHLLGALGQVELSAGDLFFKLCFSILLPLGIGKYLRRFAVDWINAQRSRLSLMSNAALISIPWMKFSESSQRLILVDTSSLAILVLSGLAIHALYLLLNGGVCTLLRLESSARKAVVLMASQKTLPVAMTVLAFLPESAVSPELKGLIAIPCITFHLGQIFVDAFLATRWGNEGGMGE
jgi:sodium/bile acid cotransporter 7